MCVCVCVCVRACVCVCVEFLIVAACGTYSGALNSYVAKPVNQSVHDPYELTSLNKRITSSTFQHSARTVQ